MSQNNDFLEGIDEQFQRQMKLSGNENGRGTGRIAAGTPNDRLIMRITELAETLSPTQKQAVLEFIETMKAKAD